jgi:hypothetical protein
MPYVLGQHVLAHNRRMRGNQAGALVRAAGGLMTGQLADRVYRSLPSFRAGPTVAQVVRATHEPKNLDLFATGLSLSSTSYTPVLLNPIVQGTSGANRTGREVRLESVRLALNFQSNASQLTSDCIRITVFRDDECRGTAPGYYADVLQNGVFGQEALNSSFNFDNIQRRFKVLFDKRITLNPSAGVTTAYGTVYALVMIEEKLGFKSHYYNASNAGTIADIDSGALYLCVTALNASNVSGWNYDSRVIFRDL